MLGLRYLQRFVVSFRDWFVEVGDVPSDSVVCTCAGRAITRSEFDELLHHYLVGARMAEQAEAHAVRCREILGVEKMHDAISDYADEIVTMHAHPTDAIRRIKKALEYSR